MTRTYLQMITLELICSMATAEEIIITTAIELPVKKSKSAKRRFWITYCYAKAKEFYQFLMDMHRNVILIQR